MLRFARGAERLRTEFIRAELPRDLRALIAFDRRVFPSDHFGAADWKRYEAYWLVVDRRRIGCCAFEKNVDSDENKRKGSVYISTTGILPAYQGMGFGTLMKAWQIAWARRHGFRRIVTNTRKRNAAMIALNRKFGFRVVRTIPGYYDDPPDSALVMEFDAGTT